MREEHITLQLSKIDLRKEPIMATIVVRGRPAALPFGSHNPTPAIGSASITEQQLKDMEETHEMNMTLMQDVNDNIATYYKQNVVPMGQLLFKMPGKHYSPLIYQNSYFIEF